MIQTLTPIISARDARESMRMPEVIFIDARGGPDAQQRYRAGHVEGAIFFDLETDLSQKRVDAARGGRHPLPDPGRFGALLGQKGIQPLHHLLVYDDKSGSNAAARFWWMMRALGHTKVQVVDGGYAAIVEAGLPVVTGSGRAMPSSVPYPATNWALPLADFDLVDQVSSRQEYLIIDVRENYRYRGESEPIDVSAGHIPGAVNAPYLNNLAADGQFRAPEELSKEFGALLDGRDMDKVIVHCGSGVTACHTLLAMEIAGFRGARLYVGSWSEWSRSGKPVSKGHEL